MVIQSCPFVLKRNDTKRPTKLELMIAENLKEKRKLPVGSLDERECQEAVAAERSSV